MRVCVFTPDLGSIRRRRAMWLRRLSPLTGAQTFEDVCFVGVRQTAPTDLDVVSYQPFVPAERLLVTRMANLVLRAADVNLVPVALARAALSRCRESIVEVVLACDPDVVVLDVGWARWLLPDLEREFPGRVSLAADLDSGAAPRPPAPHRPHHEKVSIVLPTYNGSRYIRQSIESCLDQSYNNLELIVVDDGSAEDMCTIVDEFNDPRIRYVRHETNRGLPATLNTGFSMASGAYLTWTSDDNHYAPHAIERLAGFLQRHADVAFVYASMFLIGDGDTAGGATRRALPPIDLKHQNGVGACFLYRRTVHETVGDYATEAVLVEDYDYWLRVSKQFRMQRLIEPLYYYRYHDQSLTSKYGADDVAMRVRAIRQRNGIAASH
jgi:hypothetical protein